MSYRGYFAKAPNEELIPLLRDRILKFNRYNERTGESRKWKKSYDLYFGKHVDGSDNTRIAEVGDDGELTAFGVNHYRNLIKSFLALTCAQKSSYDFRAVNSDQESLQQARLANGILDFYLTEKRMFRYQKQAAEISLVLKSGYVYETWDTTAGRALGVEPALDPDTNQPIIGDDGKPVMKIKYEGDISMQALTPWHVIYDTSLREWSKNKWTIVRTFQNKYDLAARYPKFKDQIEGLSINYDVDDFQFWRNFDTSLFTDDQCEDLIPVYEFYHLPTEALSAGRYLKFLTNGITLYGGGYQYTSESGDARLPVLRIAPGEKFDTADGYTDFYEIMALQTAVSSLYSTVYSNQSAGGVQIIWLPDGCNVSEEELGNLAILKGGLPGTEPKAVNLTSTPPEIFKNIEFIEGAMTKLAGMNSAAMGEIDSASMSGVALGRLQAMALQYSTNFQQSWAEIQEDTGTFSLRILQKFAKNERMMALGGKHNRGAMKSWSGQSINLIDRVVCDLGNPMSRVYAGRMDMADKLLDKGLITDPTKYLQLIQTGNIEPMLEAPTARLELIRKENEMLLDGLKPMALVGEDHIQHGAEHAAILADPYIKLRAEQGDQLASQIVQNTLQHIKEHEELEMTQSPFFFLIAGRQPPPPPMPPPPGPQGPGSNGGDDGPPPEPPGPTMMEPPPVPDLPAEVA